MSWGSAVYFFETDRMLMAVRQVEEYDNGCRLLDSEPHVEDEHGALAYVRVFPEDEDESAFEISAEEFETAWSKGRHT